MSLEKSLERLATAIEAQNELIIAAQAEAPADAKPKKAKAKKAEVEDDTADEVEEKPKAKKAKAKKEAPKKEEPTDEDIHSKEFYKETVQPLTRKAAGALGKDVVLGILDEFGTGVETAKDLEEGQWEEYVARLEAELKAQDDEEDDDLS